MTDNQDKQSIQISKEVFGIRREIEKKFNSFCELKSGTDVDKLKMFLFAELAEMQIKLNHETIS